MATKTLNISIPEDLVARADRQAKKQQSNRSELMRSALRSYLAKREEWDALCAVGRVYGRKSGYKEEDVVRLVRKVRKENKQRS